MFAIQWVIHLQSCGLNLTVRLRPTEDIHDTYKGYVRHSVGDTFAELWTESDCQTQTN
jgi:hypothetical protein